MCAWQLRIVDDTRGGVRPSGGHQMGVMVVEQQEWLLLSLLVGSTYSLVILQLLKGRLSLIEWVTNSQDIPDILLIHYIMLLLT